MDGGRLYRKCQQNLHHQELLHPLVGRVHAIDAPLRVGVYLVCSLECPPPGQQFTIQGVEADARYLVCHVYHLVRVYVDSHRALEVSPLREKPPFGRENLHPVVLPVGHVDPAIL